VRRSALLLLLAVQAAAQEPEQRVAREVAEAHAKGDRGRLVLLAAEPPLDVSYARVVDALLRGGHADAAEALARERQGPEAEGLVRLVEAFRKGAGAVSREPLRDAAALVAKDPEAALRALDDLRPAPDTLLAMDVSWARAVALRGLDRRDDARAEFERCAARARAVGDLVTVRDAEEARLVLSDPLQALAPAEAFLAVARLLDDRKAILRALLARAKVRVATGRRLKQSGKIDEAAIQFRDARDDCLAASDIAEQEGDRRQQGLCWRDLAVIWHVDVGQPNEALKHYSRAIERLRGVDAPADLHGTIFNAAIVLTQLARYDDALARLEEILAVEAAPALRALALEQKAYVLVRTGRLRSAPAAYAEALAAASGPARVRLLVALGELHLARRDADAALRCFADAPDEPAAWTGRAHAFGLRGEQEEAREAFRAALEREKDPVSRARWQLNAAQLRTFVDVAEALKLAWAAHGVLVDAKLPDFGNAGAAWATVAELTMLQGDHAKAAEYLAKAATLFHRLKDPQRAIDLYARETLLLLMLDQPEEAVKRLQVLMQMAETTPDDALKSAAKSAQAIFEARGGRGARAKELLVEAEGLAHAAGDRVREATVLVNRALLDPEAAAGHVRRALDLLDAERLWAPEVRPLISGASPDWGPGIALDAILKSGKEAPEDAFAFLERALGRLLLLSFRDRDAVLLAGLSAAQHDAYVEARAELIEARATGKGVAEAEAAFDATVARLRREKPWIVALAWPPAPPLAEVQQALRPDEALVMTLFDPYVKCALVVDRSGAVLRRVEKPGQVLADVLDLLAGKRTVLLASQGPADAPAGIRVCHVPTAGFLLLQRTAARPRGEGVVALGPGPQRFGPPVEQLPDRRLAMLSLGGIDWAPLRLLGRRFDADTIVVAEPLGAASAAALLAAGASNVVAGGLPPGPLDLFLAACLDRKLPVAAAFREASAKGPLLFYGPPD
jgi:tetratricopeptide (TPR) repeat protein